MDAMIVANQRGHIDAGFGVRLAYRKAGRGVKTIVVLHGGPGFTMDYLADDLLPLADRHTVVFYDQRGTGGSTLVSDAAALDAQRFADDLDSIRRHFGLQRLTLLGHSWGAGVAALYALRHPPNVERLIIVDGIPLRRAALDQAFAGIRAGGDEGRRNRLRERGDEWRADPGSAPACRAYYEAWFTPFFVDSAAMHRSKGDFCAGTPDSLKNKIANVDRFVLASLGDYDWRRGLEQVQAPALVVHGAEDPIPAESAAEWAKALPNARLLLIPGVGHFPYLEAPHTFFAAMESFVGGGWPEGARAI
jgi:proline iminopeptidase